MCPSSLSISTLQPLCTVLLPSHPPSSYLSSHRESHPLQRPKARLPTTMDSPTPPPWREIEADAAALHSNIDLAAPTSRPPTAAHESLSIRHITLPFLSSQFSRPCPDPALSLPPATFSPPPTNEHPTSTQYISSPPRPPSPPCSPTYSATTAPTQTHKTSCTNQIAAAQPHHHHSLENLTRSNLCRSLPPRHAVRRYWVNCLGCTIRQRQGMEIGC